MYSNLDIGDHANSGTHFGTVASAGNVGRKSDVTLLANASVPGSTIDVIRERWRERRSWHQAEKILTLQIKALCRRLVGGDKGEANRVFAAALGTGEHPRAEIALAAIMPLLEGRETIQKARKNTERRLATLAGALPAHAWVKTIRGMGILGLAAIVGEAGDLSLYANPAKLWRRMGLAPFQGRALSTWRFNGGLTATDWEEAGYSPRRRAVMWTIGDAMIKCNGDYRPLYLERKEIERTKAPDAQPIILHRRAQRYMEKRMLRDLWVYWRSPVASSPP